MSNEERENELFERIFELEAEIQELNDSVTWWTNRFNAVEKYNKRLKDIIKEVREYIENNKQYAELEDYGKNGEYYIDEIGLLEILDKGE